MTKKESPRLTPAQTLEKLSEIVYILEPENYQAAIFSKTKVIKSKAPATIEDLEKLVKEKPEDLVMHSYLGPLFTVLEYAQAVELFSKKPNDDKTFEAFKSRGLRNVIVKLIGEWEQGDRLDEENELEALKRSNLKQLLKVMEESRLLYGSFLPSADPTSECNKSGLLVIPSRLAYSTIRSFPDTILQSLLRDHCMLRHQSKAHAGLSEVVRIIPTGALPESVTKNFEAYLIDTNEPETSIKLFLKVFLQLLNEKFDEINGATPEAYYVEQLNAVRNSASTAVRTCQALEL